MVGIIMRMLRTILRSFGSAKRGLSMATMKKITACLLLLLMLASARAQGVDVTPWTPNYEETLATNVTPRWIEIAVDELKLSVDQQSAAEALLEDHRKRMQSFAAPNKKTYDEFTERLKGTTPDQLQHVNIQIEREEKLAQVADEQARLDGRFLEDLKLILSEEQSVRWTAFEHRLRRAIWLNLPSFFAEENIDLIKMAQAATKDDLVLEQEAAKPVADAYATELHGALGRRAEFQIQMCRRQYRNERDQYQTDGEKVWIGYSQKRQADFYKERKKQVECHRAVRDVNRRYVQPIAAVLPEGAREEFLHRYAEECVKYLVAVKQLQARDFMRKLLTREDLSPVQSEAIAALLSEHETQFRQKCEALANLRGESKAVEFSPDGPAEGHAMAARLPGEVEQLAVWENQTIKRVWELLTPEQQATETQPKVENLLGRDLQPPKTTQGAPTERPASKRP